jgi:hypothetical protein
MTERSKATLIHYRIHRLVAPFAIEGGSAADTGARARARPGDIHTPDANLESSSGSVEHGATVQPVLLHALDTIDAERARLRAFAEGVRHDGYTRVVPMGNGGIQPRPGSDPAGRWHRTRIPAVRAFVAVTFCGERGARRRGRPRTGLGRAGALSRRAPSGRHRR